MTQFIKFSFPIILLSFFLAGFQLALAAQSYSVGPGSTITINEWGVCQKVTNAAGYPTLFIPTNSANEWAQFLAHKPSQVTVGACTTVIPSTATVDVWVQHGCVPGMKFSFAVSSLPQTFNGNGDQMRYTVSKVGDYIKINSHHTYTGYTIPGGFLNAVMINGVPGYPNGIWANSVVSYVLGSGGVAAANVNALGDQNVQGYIFWAPGGWGYYTETGNGESEIVLGF